MRGTVIGGVWLLVAAGVIPLLIFGLGSVGGWEDAIVSGILAIMFGFVISPILALVGIIMIIVGASSGNQNQQQQVVVHVAQQGAPCRCGAGISPTDRFCQQCGAPVRG